MKQKELKIIGLSYSQSKIDQYILILGEKRGKLKLPIIIKESEAQYLALKLEDIKPPRLQIFDLIKNITDNFNADLFQVSITHVLEGVFQTKLHFSNMIEEFEIPCSIGDAICLSVSYGCEIYCAEEVLKLTGILMDEDGNIDESQHNRNVTKKRDYSSVMTVTDLEKMLHKAIASEDYEIASQIRDKITELKEKTK
jgi:uncharacterized protein